MTRRCRILLLLCGLAAGCTQFQPFVTVPTEKPVKVTEPGPRVAVCHDPMWSDFAKAEAVAQDECGPNARPQKVSTDYLLENCPTLLPAHTTFICVPTK